MSTEGSDDVNDFLLRIKQLGEKTYVNTLETTIVLLTISSDREDELRTKQLEQDILEGRRRRQALRQERARSLLSSDKSMRTAAHTPPPSSLRTPPTRTLLDEPFLRSEIYAKKPSTITATLPVSSSLESTAEPETTILPSSHEANDIKSSSKKADKVEVLCKVEPEFEIGSSKSESVSAKPCIEAIDLTNEPDSPAKEVLEPEITPTLNPPPKFEPRQSSPKEHSPKQISPNQVSPKYVSPQPLSSKQAFPKQVTLEETSLPQFSPKQLSPKHPSSQQLLNVTLSPATELAFEPVTREPPTTPTKPKHIPSLPSSPALHVRFNNRSQHSPVKASLANVTSPSSPRGSFLATRQMSSFQSKPKTADSAAAASAQPFPPPIVNNTNGAHMSGNPPAPAGTFLASRTNTPIPIRTISPVRGGFVQSAMLKRHDSVSFQRARAGSTTDSPDLMSPFSTASTGSGSSSNNGSPTRGFSRSASVSPRKGHARTQSLNSMSYSISSPSFAGYMSKGNDLNEIVPVPTPNHNLVQRMGKLNLNNSPRLGLSPNSVEEVCEDIPKPEPEAAEPEVEVKPVLKLQSPKLDESPEMMERLRRLKEMKELTAKHQMRERSEQERRLQLRHEREMKRREELQNEEEAVKLEKPAELAKTIEPVEVIESVEPMEIVEETVAEEGTVEELLEVAEPVDLIIPTTQEPSPVELDDESAQDDSASVSATDMSPKSSSSSDSSVHQLPVERPTTPVPSPARTATLSSQTSPVRRWNPVRSTWLESALKKTPSSPGGDRGNTDRSHGLAGGANSPVASGLTSAHSVSFPRGKVPLPAPLGSFVKNSPPKSLNMRNPLMVGSLREERKPKELVEERVAKEEFQAKQEPAQPEIAKSSIHEPLDSTVLPKVNRSHLFAPGRAPKPRVPSPSSAMLLNRASTLRPTPKKTAAPAVTPEALERLRQLRAGTQNRFVPSTQDQSDLVQFKANLKRSSTVQHVAPDAAKETILGARSSLRSAAATNETEGSMMGSEPSIGEMEEPTKERLVLTPLGPKREVNEQAASLEQTEGATNTSATKQAALPSPPTLATSEKVLESPTTPTSLEQRAWVPSPPLSPAAKHVTVTPLQDESENEDDDYVSEGNYEDEEEEEIIYAPPPRSMPKPIRGGIVSKGQADSSQTQQDENTPPSVVA